MNIPFSEQPSFKKESRKSYPKENESTTIVSCFIYANCNALKS